jgi:hypothetical protein
MSPFTTTPAAEVASVTGVQLEVLHRDHRDQTQFLERAMRMVVLAE